MRLRLQELQAKDKQAQKARIEYSEDWDNIDAVLHYQSLPYIPEIIQRELISSPYYNLLAGHFDIRKIRELAARKYYWPLLCHNVKKYVKECNICLSLKAVRYKFYGDLQFLLVPIHR